MTRASSSTIGLIAAAAILSLAAGAAWSLYPVARDLGLVRRFAWLDVFSGDRWMPQRWVFFTADPERVSMQAHYRTLRGGAIVPAGTLGGLRNYLGFRRQARLEMLELQHLATKGLPYSRCVVGLAACLAEARVFPTVVNDWVAPTLCGVATLVWSRPVAWSRFVARNDGPEPITVAHGDFKC